MGHNRYLSAYNLRNKKWTKEHIDFGDQVTNLVQIGRFGGDPDEIKLGVFVGYQTVRFMEYYEEKFDYKLTDFFLSVSDPVQEVCVDAQNEAVCYLVCKKLKSPPSLMMDQFDPITRLHNPLVRQA